MLYVPLRAELSSLCKRNQYNVTVNTIDGVLCSFKSQCCFDICEYILPIRKMLCNFSVIQATLYEKYLYACNCISLSAVIYANAKFDNVWWLLAAMSEFATHKSASTMSKSQCLSTIINLYCWRINEQCQHNIVFHPEASTQQQKHVEYATYTDILFEHSSLIWHRVTTEWSVAVLACHYKTLYSYSSNISLNDPPKEPTDIPIIIRQNVLMELIKCSKFESEQHVLNYKHRYNRNTISTVY